MQDDPTTPFDMGQVRSIEDYGTDLRTGDRMFRVTVATENIVLRFRLRQLLGKGPGKAWFVIGYLPDPSGAGGQCGGEVAEVFHKQRGVNRHVEDAAG